jgi:hypothetical protein
MIFLISTFQVARIIGMIHQHMAHGVPFPCSCVEVEHYGRQHEVEQSCSCQRGWEAEWEMDQEDGTPFKGMSQVTLY